MPSPSELRLGTRGSPLALWQANTVAARIVADGGPACRVVVIKTSGDRLQQAPLSEIGGKRLFVKEIEDALLQGEIDLAVHSSKDLPAILPDGLTLGAVLPREDPRDAVILAALSPQPSALSSLEDLIAALGGAPSIGTGSVRRIAQLMRLLPNARFAPIRGNLDTRLRKVDQGEYDALVLAAAGLRRLGLASRISFALPTDACVPAPGQGIVAVEIREGDHRVGASVAAIDDRQTAAALTAERALVEALGGGCQTPIGALATVGSDGQMSLLAIVSSLDGARVVRATAAGPATDGRAIGIRVAERLVADGAGDILTDVRRAQDGESPDARAED